MFTIVFLFTCIGEIIKLMLVWSNILMVPQYFIIFV